MWSAWVFSPPSVPNVITTCGRNRRIRSTSCPAVLEKSVNSSRPSCRSISSWCVAPSTLQDAANSFRRISPSAAPDTASPRFLAACPSVRQTTYVSTPRSAARASTPPNAKHSSSGCATTHINFKPTQPPQDPHPQITDRSKPYPRPQRPDPPPVPERTSADAAPMAPAPQVLADAPASHIPYAKPTHTLDCTKQKPPTNQPRSPLRPLKAVQIEGLRNYRKKVLSAGKDGRAAWRQS